jgi:cobalt-zinc-cadmium efflux system outer membrane protein
VRFPTYLALAVTILTSQACASAQSPGRERVAAGIAKRVDLPALTLPPTSTDWSPPPGTTLDDGLAVEEAVSFALWNNADFQTALAGLGLARADLIEAGLLRNPIFSLLLPWGPKQLEFAATLAADQIWQRPKRIADARLNAEAVAEQLIATGLRLVGDVRLAFFDALASERRLTLAAEQTEIATRTVALVEGQLRAGEVSEFEARLARAEAVRLHTARLGRLSARDLALVRLRTLAGLEPSRDIRLVEPPLLGSLCAPSEELLKSALMGRPDVRAAELQLEAAGLRAGLERARILSLTASLDANAKGSQGFEMGPGLAVELPILSQNQGRRARSAAELEQARRRYVALRASVAADLAAANIGLSEARQTALLLNEDAAATLGTAGQQAERLYAAGEISLLALLQTRQRLIELEVARTDARFGVHRAVVGVELAAGNSCGARR